MKKIITLFLFLIYCSLQSQSLSIFNIDTSAFPAIKAKFWAFDKDGNRITNLSTEDFQVTENGVPRTITRVSCPPELPPQALSSVLVMDASGSMADGNLNLAKEAAKAWIEGLPLGKSECAITAFSSSNYLIQDFTTDRNLLLQKANSLKANGGTDYDMALINPLAGGLLITKQGKNKRVIVFLSDGMPNREPQTSKIISEANTQNVTIYAVTLGMTCPQSLKDISIQTGGQWYESITTEDHAKLIYQHILQIAQGGEPCEIEWQSGISCTAGNTQVELTLLRNGTKATTSYQRPNQSIAKLEFNPLFLKFAEPSVGVKAEQKITVTARNSDFTITNLISNNAAFTITPTNFVLNAGQSRELTVSYIPADSGYVYCRFDIENDICPTKFQASGGWMNKKPTIRTIRLLHPNGGEVFVVGSDTVITWEGVPPDEPVKIEYSTNNGTKWITIAEKATGLSYNWRVPKTPSNLCLARVTAAAKTSTYCDNPDVELCGKIWMGCNLNVDTYRNGDPIPEVTDPTEWANLKTGAWCYYDNDPTNGEIYGKLYNWYAVNDPRGLAPDGWHVPTDAEWKELEMCLGGASVAGGKLKSTGTVEGGDGLWYSPNTGATNESSFSALPGGWRDGGGGQFEAIGYYGHWLSATEYNAAYTWKRYLWWDKTNLYKDNYNRRGTVGYSIRLVRD